jgi:ElaB/YqjD/DUF883 family membrane-anchored ribosome-binding protein
MSQNFNNTNNPSTGGAGTGATDAGTTRDTTLSGSTGATGGGGSTGGGSTGAGSTGLSTPGSTGGGAAAGTATAREGLAGAAQEYGQKITDAATQAKDYVGDKLSVAGDRLRELQQKDYSQIADEAKEYARQKPGQALLISAAAGFLLGLLLRSTRR